MARDEKIKMQWEEIQKSVSDKFGGGEKLDIDAIIYLIGIQELGKGYKKFSKDEKLNIMHISICKLLEPFGYYEFDYFDEDGWPHYKVLDELPTLKGGEQSVLMKEDLGGVLHDLVELGRHLTVARRLALLLEDRLHLLDEAVLEHLVAHDRRLLDEAELDRVLLRHDGREPRRHFGHGQPGPLVGVL